MTLELSIPSTYTLTPADGSAPYTVYKLTITQPLRSQTLPKRYSDFVALNDALISEVRDQPSTTPGSSGAAFSGTSPPVPLPPKSWVASIPFFGKLARPLQAAGLGGTAAAAASSSTIADPVKVEARRVALERYMRAIAGADDHRWRRCPAWAAFLELSATAASPTSAALLLPSSTSTIQADQLTRLTADPTGWLECHTEAKRLLRTARTALARRDEIQRRGSRFSSNGSAADDDFGTSYDDGGGGGVSGVGSMTASEASTTARRSLLRAATFVAALDRGLRTLTPDDNGKGARSSRRNTADADATVDTVAPTLGPGEVRRRRDLLSATRRERDGLEAVLSSSLAGPNGDDDDGGSRDGAAGIAKPNGGSGSGSGATDKQRLLAGSGARARGRILGAASPPKVEGAGTRELDNSGLVLQQRDIMRAQDQDVDQLAASVRKIRDMGVLINEELALQSDMLGVVDSDITRVDDKVAVSKRRITKLK